MPRRLNHGQPYNGTSIPPNLIVYIQILQFNESEGRRTAYKGEQVGIYDCIYYLYSLYIQYHVNNEHAKPCFDSMALR